MVHVGLLFVKVLDPIPKTAGLDESAVDKSASGHHDVVHPRGHESDKVGKKSGTISALHSNIIRSSTTNILKGAPVKKDVCKVPVSLSLETDHKEHDHPSSLKGHAFLLRMVGGKLHME